MIALHLVWQATVITALELLLMQTTCEVFRRLITSAKPWKSLIATMIFIVQFYIYSFKKKMFILTAFCVFCLVATLHNKRPVN